MKVLIQKVSRAKCCVNEQITGRINQGLLLFVGFTYQDNIEIINKMVKKIINLRIFTDENGKMNYNIKQISGEILSISQFTLYANCNDGHRPSFTEALPGKEAKELYETFNVCLRKEDIIVQTGIFGEHMEIDLTNDGPITIMLEY